jgi:hypothetical protein
MSAQLLAAADATCNAILNAITNTRDDVVVESPQTFRLETFHAGS